MASSRKEKDKRALRKNNSPCEKLVLDMCGISICISKQLILLHMHINPCLKHEAVLHVNVPSTGVRLTTAETGKGFSSLTFAVRHRFLMTMQN